MINIYFVYKGSPISHVSMDMEYTEDNLKLVDGMIEQGLIERPENVDRIIKQEHMLDSIWVG
jgi:hypothetical protein